LKKYGLNELRELFLAFFEEKGHLRLPSFPLVPQNDASLLLINSGMAPMKTWFTGEQEPPNKRVCTCQKCIRTNDIENVGKTSRHGSYFEMLGNFSFGDYFKHEAIEWCWEFLTERLGVNPDLLHPSVYFEDDEAFNIWVDVVGLAPERITKLGKEDNFWDHGSGPCGPCSEVYFDRGIENGCGSPDCAPGCDCDRYIEVWNNVFTQFNNDGSNNYSELQQKNIDTGMGLERIALVCQGVDGFFDIDTIAHIVNKVSELSGVPYNSDKDSDVSIRIITDHARAATMMICDGVLPSNEGRGYVLRRLLRRAVRHGRQLGIKDEFICTVCDVVIEQNKGAYPDLIDRADFIKRVVQVEEENFDKTIDAGTAMLNSLIEALKAQGSSVLLGEDAFKLYDTYGFPLDLTIDMLEEHDITVDTEAFNEQMEAQRTRARKAREALGDLAWAGIELGLDNTPTVFTGYDKTSDTGRVLAIVNQGELSSSIREGDEGIIVLDKTPFYAEKGGQSADFGTLTLGDSVFKVTDVQLSNGDKDLHYGKMVSGEISVDDAITADVDVSRRRAIMRAHTATHLLHKALHKVLGDHVNQAGSLVEPDKLRFDFTHFSALTDEEVADIEQLVNTAILDGFSVAANEMSINDAKNMGATALFGEKYGDTVRVISMGDSVELCGGIHLDNTAKAGAFTILSEFSVASGVRRIEAITGYSTLSMLNSSREQLSEITGMLKANSPDDIISKLEQNMATIKDLRSKLESAQSKESGEEARLMIADAKKFGELNIVTKIIKNPNVELDSLRGLLDTLRDLDNGVVSVIAAVKGDKITIMAACGKTAIQSGVKAGELIREVTKICGGSGGGKPEFAMGGAKDADKLIAALESVEGLVTAKLS